MTRSMARHGASGHLRMHHCISMHDNGSACMLRALSAGARFQFGAPIGAKHKQIEFQNYVSEVETEGPPAAMVRQLRHLFAA